MKLAGYPALIKRIKNKMSFLRWDQSTHWNKPIIELPEPAVELPIAGQSRHEIIDAIRDDPRYNAMNPSNQQHIIDMAIEAARISGTLVEEGELVNG